MSADSAAPRPIGFWFKKLLLGTVIASIPSHASFAASSGGSTVQLDTIDVQGSAADLQSPDGPGVGFVASRSRAGTKTDTPIVETSQSISVITPQQIAEQGAQTVNQALAYTAGVQTAPYGYDSRYDQFVIRGFSANQYGNYRDGLRQASGNFGYFRNEPYDLERIEVLRGPTSILYGSNDPGGLVNLVSKVPVATPFAEAGIDIGNYDRYQGRFDFGTPADPNGNLAYRMTGLFRESGTQVPGFPDNRVNLSPSVTAHLGDSTTLTILGNYAQNRTGAWPYYLYVPGRGVTRQELSDPKYDRLNQDQWSLGYELEHRFSDDLIVRQKFRVLQVNWDGRFQDIDSLSDDGLTLNRYSAQIFDHVTGINLDNQVQAKAFTGPVGHTFLGGIDYFHSEFSELFNYGSAPSIDLLNPVFIPQTEAPSLAIANTFQSLDQVGIYGQDQMRWGGFRLTLGVREDLVQQSSKDKLADTTTSSDPTHLTGKAGLLYLFDNGIAPYVSYANSFLPVSNTTSPERGSRPFVPTTGESFEGGVKYQPVGINAIVTASVFQITQDNVSTTDPDNDLYSIQTGQIRSRGFEIEGTMTLAEGWNGITSFSYTDPKVTKSNEGDLGKVPISTPNYLASAFLDYTIPYGAFAGVGGGAGVRYVGKTWADPLNTERNPSIFAVDLAAHYTYQHINLNISARNIFDQEVGICDGYQTNCTFSQGRTVLGSLTARF